LGGFLIQTQFLSTWAFAGTMFCAIGWALIAILK
jgi:hypothetical protein